MLFGTKPKKNSLCILYLCVPETLPFDKVQSYVSEYKKNLYEGQGFDKFLASHNYHFVVVPVVRDQTRMEFVSF